MIPIVGLSLLELAEFLRGINQPSFRAKQIFRWLYHEFVTDFGSMTDLPRHLRAQLGEYFEVETIHPIHTLTTDSGNTEKVLVELSPPSQRQLEGPLAERRRRFNSVESVLMIYPGDRIRRTVCVSSQAGCAMGCQFCATGQSGFIRDLTAGEIVGQVLHFARRTRELHGADARLTNLVFMGQGEPFANFENVWRAVELLHAPEAFGLGARHITLSTVGVVPIIRELILRPLQVNLAVSLHAADDALRSRLVPLNRRYQLDEILSACRDYVGATHRRISFEYTCMDGINDSEADAVRLAERVRGILCHVNLIPMNATPGAQFQPSPPKRIERMVEALTARGIPTTVRDTRGKQIDAACGQLRARLSQAAPEELSIAPSGD